MNRLERILLGIIALEIPLQIDAYLGSPAGSDTTYGAVIGINVSITTFCLFGLYFLCLVEAAAKPERTPFRWLMSAPLAIYACIATLSLIVAANQFLAISYLAILTQALLLFLYLANRLQSRDDIVFLMTMLAVSMVLQSVTVIACWLRSSQMIGHPISICSVRFEVTDDGRPCGTLCTPVSAGSFIALLLVPVGSLLLTPVSRRVKVIALFALLTGALAIPLTQTRGAIAAVGIAAAVFSSFTLVRGWFPKWAFLTGALIAVVAAFPLYQTYQNRIAQGDKGSAASRIHLAKIAWELIGNQPLIGVGAGNYYASVESYADSTPFRSEWAYTVHCDYLLVWAENGIFGLCAYIAFFLTIVYRGWRVWRAGDPFLSILALAFAAAILGLMTHMFVDLFNARPHLQILMCCAALVVAMERLSAAVGVEAVVPINFRVAKLKQATA
jgi:O-antigen ligase